MLPAESSAPATDRPSGSLLSTGPGRYFTDPGVCGREQRMIFERVWCCAVRAAEIAGPDAFRVARIGADSVITVRGGDGALRVLLNVCRHRGARLCAEDEGQVRRSLRCGYHAWTYDLDGRLVAAPDLVAMPESTASPTG